MEIAINDAGTTAIVTLAGKLDILGADVVAMPLAMLSGAKQGLIIDMAGVTFLASIGIRHLVSATKVLARKGGQLVLLNPTDVVTDVIATSGLTDLLKISRSENEARAALGIAP